MITDKDKREIKGLIDEAIEAQRKNRNAAYLWSFAVGCIGAGIFFIGTLILFGLVSFRLSFQNSLWLLFLFPFISPALPNMLYGTYQLL